MEGIEPREEKDSFVVATICREDVACQLEDRGIKTSDLYNPDNFTRDDMETIAADMMSLITEADYWAVLAEAVDRDIERRGLLVCESCNAVFEKDQDFILCVTCRINDITEIKPHEA